ncbi:MAG: hypothetical protein AAGA18_15670 [Verrucomicrobiota bacterium]
MKLQISEETQEVFIDLEDRLYRLRGMEKNNNLEVLKLNLRIKANDRIHFDTLDLYNARSRKSFVAVASDITGALREEIEKDLTTIIELIEPYQEERLKQKLQTFDQAPELSPEQEQEALAFLRDPNLIEKIQQDFDKVGLVGEESNRLLGYLITISRKLDRPLCGQIMARSASGKSYLMNALLSFVPPEDKHVMTSLTAQALFYMHEESLKNKVLAIPEDEGSTQATYPLKILGSEGELTLAVTVRDPDSGFPQTKIRKIKASVAQLTTSTKPEIDYELGTRYLILTVDESQEQTKRIHAAQREAETLKGHFKRIDKEKILNLHHNAQRLLRPLAVHNPYAEQLSFPDDQLRLRRDNPKFLGLIRTIAYLRQYQKTVESTEYKGRKIDYIEVDKQDIEIAHGLAKEFLGRTLDELSPPTRSFLLVLDDMVESLAEEKNLKRHEVRFTRKEAREFTKWGVTQVRDHLERLVELEWIIRHRIDGPGAQYCYQLVYQAQESQGWDLPQIQDVGGRRPVVGRKTVKRRASS